SALRCHALGKQLYCWITHHRTDRLLRDLRRKVQRRNAIAVFSLYPQQFAARCQKMNLCCFLKETFCEGSNRFDQVLTAIEDDEELLRTDHVQQFGGCILHLQGKPQRGSDGSRNVTRISQASQVNKMDPIERLRHPVSDGDSNGRLPDPAGTEQGDEPIISNPILDIVENRL